MPRKVSLERQANLARAVHLVVHHGASYQSVAEHCNLPIGTVAYEVWKWRREARVMPAHRTAYAAKRG